MNLHHPPESTTEKEKRKSIGKRKEVRSEMSNRSLLLRDNEEIPRIQNPRVLMT